MKTVDRSMETTECRHKKRQLTINLSVDSWHNVSTLFLVNDSLDSVLPVGQVCSADRTQKNTLFLMGIILLAGHCCRHRSCVLRSASA